MPRTAESAGGARRFHHRKVCREIAGILAEWSACLLRSPGTLKPLRSLWRRSLLRCFPSPTESRVVRSSSAFRSAPEYVRAPVALLDTMPFFGSGSPASISQDPDGRTPDHGSRCGSRGSVVRQLNFPSRVQTRVRYEIVGAGAGFHREQRIGNWELYGSRLLLENFVSAAGACSTKQWGVPIRGSMPIFPRRSRQPFFLLGSATAWYGLLAHDARRRIGHRYLRTQWSFSRRHRQRWL